MKVACLTGISRSSGGLFYAVSSLCKSLRRDGVDVSVFGRNDAYVEEDRPAWDPVPVVPYRGFGPLGYSPKLLRMLQDSGADLVHQHGIWLDDQREAQRWKKKSGQPVVVSTHGMLDSWALRNSAWKKKLVGSLFANESLREATCIHALCRSEVESIRAYGLENPVALIPNGVDLPKLEKRKPAGDSKTLLFLGRIHPKKGLKELVEAWRHFSGGWELVIAGWDDGGHEQEIRALASGLEISFAGPKYGAEKEKLLRESDAFILPSFSEGLPMSVLEAWSYGLPVLMTGHCNLPEGFAVGAAIRIEPDAQSILQNLEHLATLSGPELEAMGAKGRRLVEEKFVWPKIAGDMLKVYEWCRTGMNPPSCMEF